MHGCDKCERVESERLDAIVWKKLGLSARRGDACVHDSQTLTQPLSRH